MQQHGSIFFACRPLLAYPRGWGQNSTFSEHAHVAYRIKGNHECSKMVATIVPTDPPRSWEWATYEMQQFGSN